MTTTTIETQLRKELLAAHARLQPPDAIGDDSPAADELDGSQVITNHEIDWTTREMLAERVKRLSAALDRIRDGSYGVCVECHEPIARARVSAIPEVETCVACQTALERLDRQPTRSREPLFVVTPTE